MPTRWKRGGHYEQAVLSYFNKHERGTYKDIIKYLKTLPTQKDGVKRRNIPDAGMICSIMRYNKIQKEKIRGHSGYANLYHRPKVWILIGGNGHGKRHNRQ